MNDAILQIGESDQYRLYVGVIRFQDRGDLHDIQPVLQKMELGLGNLDFQCAFCHIPTRKKRFFIF
jgi:hypothetical protein